MPTAIKYTLFGLSQIVQEIRIFESDRIHAADLFMNEFRKPPCGFRQQHADSMEVLDTVDNLLPKGHGGKDQQPNDTFPVSCFPGSPIGSPIGNRIK